MSLEIRYGIDSGLEIANAAAVRLGFHSAATGPDDVVAAARAALAAPLEYPSLTQAVVPGDQVVVVLERGVPHGTEIATAVAEHLVEAGFDPDDITLLQADAAIQTATLPIRTAAAVLTGEAVNAGEVGPPSQGRAAGQVRVTTHDPNNRDSLAYLTNTPSGRPIYLNRMLLDADMIIPIGCYRGDLSWSYRGLYGSLYPTFSNDATHARYRNPHMLDTRDEVFAKSQREVDSVGRLAGMQFTVQVLPGPVDEVAEILAGETSAVARRAETWWNSAWRNPRPEPAEVVVVALAGPHSRNWSALGRALEMATALVEEGGSILVCSDLEHAPGPAFELLSQVDDRDGAIRQIRKDRPVDGPAALLLAAAQDRARVYLLSRLDSSDIDELGMTPIDEAADVARFCAKRRSCTVVADGRNVSLTARPR